MWKSALLKLYKHLVHQQNAYVIFFIHLVLNHIVKRHLNYAFKLSSRYINKFQSSYAYSSNYLKWFTSAGLSTEKLQNLKNTFLHTDLLSKLDRT